MWWAIWNSENVNKLSKIIANYMDTLNILWSIRACLLSIPLSSPARSCMNSTTSHDPLELFVSSGSSNRDSSLCLKYTYLSYSLLILNKLGLPHWANLPYFTPMFLGSWLDRQIRAPYSTQHYPVLGHNSVGFQDLALFVILHHRLH